MPNSQMYSHAIFKIFGLAGRTFLSLYNFGTDWYELIQRLEKTDLHAIIHTIITYKHELASSRHTFHENESRGPILIRKNSKLQICKVSLGLALLQLVMSLLKIALLCTEQILIGNSTQLFQRPKEFRSQHFFRNTFLICVPNDFINLFLPAGLRVLTNLNGIEKFTERQLNNMQEMLGHLEIKRIKLFKIYVTYLTISHFMILFGLASIVIKKQIRSPIPYSIEIWKKLSYKSLPFYMKRIRDKHK